MTHLYSWVDVTIVTKIVDPEVLMDTSGQTFTWTNNAGLTPERTGDNDIYWASSNASLSHIAMTKEMTYDKTIAPNAHFVIDYNPDKMDIDPNHDTIDIYDKSSKTLQVSPDSIRVVDKSNNQALKKGQDYTVDMNHMSDQNLFVVTVPDDKHLEIRYTAEVIGANGQEVAISNSAYFKGRGGSNPATIDKTVVVMKGAGQSISDRMIWLDKRDNTGERLANTSFGLYQYQNGKWSKHEDININEPDDTKVPRLEERVLYKLVEERAADGYVKDDTPHYFVLRESQEETFEKPANLDDGEIRSMPIAGTMTVYNNPSHTLTIEKVDQDGKTLPGASFELRDQSGNIAMDAHKENRIAFTSGEEPVSFQMAAGEYTLVETSVPEGYLLADPVPLTITDSGSILLDGVETEEKGVAVIENRQTKIAFLKMDARHNVPLAGADLQILCGGEVVESWTSGEEPKEFTGLKTDTDYVLHEESAPAGFALTRDIPFSISNKGEVQIEAEADESGAYLINDEYKAVGSVTLSAYKTIIGQTLGEDDFHFELKDEEGTVLQTKGNLADGTVTFDPLTFTQDHLNDQDEGTYIYTITEVDEGKTGYTYDPTEYTVTVTLKDNGDGTITAEADKSGEDVAFSNIYEAKGEITLTAVKQLKGSTLMQNQFRFELKDSDGKVLQTKTNRADGSITFDPLYYTQADLDKEGKGTFAYTISEIMDGRAGFTYDKTEYKVTVSLTDRRDGTIEAASDLNGKDILFENIYQADGTVTLNVSKLLKGRVLEKDQFTFELKDENGKVLQSVQNDADGTVSFETLSYTQADLDADGNGSYTYTISEVNDHQKGYAYDPAEYTVTVTLKDNGDGSVRASADYGADETGAERSGIRFVNAYQAEGSFTVKALKSLSGRDIEDGEFSFLLSDEEGELQKAAAKADGSITFEPIRYTLNSITDDCWTHVYTLKEEAGTAENVTYDDTVFTITVEVTDAGDGTLQTNVSITDGTTSVDDILFENTYEDPDDLNGKREKKKDKKKPEEPKVVGPKTEDATPVAPVAGALTVSLVVLLLAAADTVRRMRHRG